MESLFFNYSRLLNRIIHGRIFDWNEPIREIFPLLFSLSQFAVINTGQLKFKGLEE